MINVKTGECSDCMKTTKLIAGRCQSCYWKYRARAKGGSKGISKTTRHSDKFISIAKISSKRKAQNVLYLKKRRIFMEQNKTCKAKLSGCTHLSTDLHHLKGRCGELLNDETNFIALCRSCHSYIEEHPNFAKENGFSRSRLDIFLT